MKNWRTAGEASTEVLDLLLGGDFVIPDTGSLKLTVRNNAGAVLAGLDHLVLADSLISTVTLTIPAPANALTGGNMVESRYLAVDFTAAGKPGQVRRSYNLSAFVPLRVVEADVRALVGASPQELPDDDIDILGAYYDLTYDVGDTLTTALTAAPRAAQAANKAVAIQALLEVFPSLQARLLAEEAENADTYKRSKLDFVALRADLEAVKASELATMAAVLQGVSITPPTMTIFSVATPTDVITGQ